jgi:hypothetical protein
MTEEKEVIEKAIKAGRASVKTGDSTQPITSYRVERYCTILGGSEIKMEEEDEIIIHQPKRKQ